MELKEGMYVRTNEGKITKIIEIDKDEFERFDKLVDFTNYEIIKASYNIIDLIKHKDIILGKDGKLYQCWKVYKDYVFTYSKNKQGQTITLVDYQIDKVMCYELFESMSYKVV